MNGQIKADLDDDFHAIGERSVTDLVLADPRTLRAAGQRDISGTRTKRTEHGFKLGTSRSLLSFKN